jgi:putative phosphonate metabolism protein
MSARYAIYYAPSPGSLLWQAGCRWLGSEPDTQQALAQPAVPGLPAERVAALTRAARRYGLHATLKPPFRLADGQDRDTLDAALAAFARAQAPFGCSTLALGVLSGFLALRPAARCAALDALADACVIRFDGFRRPADEQELARRRGTGLTARQEELLLRFGYPYVLEEYRFHITLTDRLAPADRAILAPWLARYFSDALSEPLTLHDICLFVQEQANAPFRLLRRHPLGGTNCL